MVYVGDDYLTYKEFCVLKCIKNGSFMSKISKESDVTYSHAIKILYKFRKKDFIKTIKRSGRRRYVYLSDKGRKLQDLMFELEKLIGDKTK